MEYNKELLCIWLPTLWSIQQSKEDKLTLPKVVYNGSPFVQVAKVCKVFGLFIFILLSNVWFQKKLFYDNRGVSCPFFIPCFVLLCFQFFTCQQRICIANMKFFALNDDLNVDTHFFQQTLPFAYIWSICGLYLINLRSIKLVSHR